MGRYFLETSVFTKRYKQEIGSTFINKLFQENNELFYLNLTILEIQKIFYRLYLWPQSLQSDIQITKEKFQNLEAQFAEDLLLMKRIELTEEMIGKSAKILEKIWLRSAFDLAQLSAYLIANEIYSDLIFVCSDIRSNLINAAKQFVPENNIIIP